MNVSSKKKRQRLGCTSSSQLLAGLPILSSKTMKATTAIKKLEKISKDYNNTELKRVVAEMVIDELDGYEKAEDFFSDLSSHGCISGMIGGLIYYADTYKFFDDNYEDIMDLVHELNDQGLEINLETNDGNIKNNGAWLAFEETSRQLADELGLEI